MMIQSACHSVLKKSVLLIINIWSQLGKLCRLTTLSFSGFAHAVSSTFTQLFVLLFPSSAAVYLVHYISEVNCAHLTPLHLCNTLITNYFADPG